MVRNYKKIIREWLEAFLFSVLIAGLLYFVFWPFRVEGPSMQPMMENGDRVAISRVVSYFTTPDYGDVIICKISVNGKKDTIIKRIVALPDDFIEINDGRVMVNGSELIEEYVFEDHTEGQVSIQLEKDEYFVLGDNRQMSYDSRDMGVVHRTDMIGKVIMRIFPFHKIKLF